MGEETDPFEDEVDEFLAETLAADEAQEAAHQATRRVVELAEDATIPQTIHNYLLNTALWIEHDPWEFFITLMIILLPLAVITTYGTYKLAKQSFKKEGMEMPSMSNGWSFDTKKKIKSKSSAKARLKQGTGATKKPKKVKKAD